VLIIAPKTEGGITAVSDNYLKADLNKSGNILVHPSTFESSGYRKIYFFLKQLLLTLYLLIKYRPDIIHIHLASKGSYYRKSFHLILGKIFRKKIIIQIHANHFTDFISDSNKIQRKYILQTLSFAKILITLTHEVHDYLSNLRMLKNVEIRLLENPIYLEDYNTRDNINRDESTLLYLGWIVKEKGVYDLLEAAPIVKSRLKNFKIVLCGNKETQLLRTLVQKNNLQNYIIVNDWINGKEIIQLLQKATALILPSYSEAMPNVILEAMASGAPIISTSVGQIPAILKDYKNCLYIKTGNVESISEKIIELFTNSNLQKSIRTQNLQDVKRFDAKKIVTKLHRIYEEI